MSLLFEIVQSAHSLARSSDGKKSIYWKKVYRFLQHKKKLYQFFALKNNRLFCKIVTPLLKQILHLKWEFIYWDEIALRSLV